MTMKKGLKLPPGPGKVPVLGNLHQLTGPLPHHTLRDLAQVHGPVMLLRLGTVPVVVLSSAKVGMEMLKAHDADCSNRPMSPGPELISYGFKSVAFAPNGPYWLETRKILVNELLSPRRVKAAWYARQEQVLHYLHECICNFNLYLMEKGVYIYTRDL
jgi:4-hydroxyphenylacetaldehyde oxime monooxygenase